MFCQKCGAENKDGAAFCNSCGVDLRIAPVTAADPLTTGACESCGTWVPVGEKLCSRCLAIKLEDIKGPTISKNSKIIAAKIAAKKEEINNISQAGPVLTVIVGIFFCIFIIGAITGIPLIIFAIWWSSNREKEKKKLQGELTVLEIELAS